MDDWTVDALKSVTQLLAKKMPATRDDVGCGEFVPKTVSNLLWYFMNVEARPPWARD